MVASADGMGGRKKKKKNVMMGRRFSCKSRLKVFFFLKSSPHLLSGGHVVQRSRHLLGKDQGQQQGVGSCLYSTARQSERARAQVREDEERHGSRKRGVVAGLGAMRGGEKRDKDV